MYGDASGALKAIHDVQDNLRKLSVSAVMTSNKIGSVFSGAFNVVGKLSSGLTSVFRGLSNLVGNLLTSAFHKLKYAMAGMVGVGVYAVKLWNDEIKAQTRLDFLLKGNIKNWKGARSEIDQLIKTTMRRTNYGDDDIRGIAGAFIQMNRGRGVEYAKRLAPGILDYASATGGDPAGLAEAIGRAIATGQSTMLRRQGIMVDDRAFKRNPVGAIESSLATLAPGAAQAERLASPWRAKPPRITFSRIIGTFSARD